VGASPGGGSPGAGGAAGAAVTLGTVALVRFPFSDLSNARLRPAVVLADSGRGDWVLCQVTSNPYADPDAVEFTAVLFAVYHRTRGVTQWRRSHS
jgi:hypothetical protein